MSTYRNKTKKHDSSLGHTSSRVNVPQLRFERQASVHSQFLNMWGEQDQRRKGFKLLSSYFLANLKPPAALPCKNQLTPHLFLNVLMGVSQISVVVSNSPWMMELFLAGTLSGVGCSSPVGLASTGMGPAENINVGQSLRILDL